MISAALMLVVCGVVALAVIVDVGAAIAWVRRRWR
jgi:hypothetical protein